MQIVIDDGHSFKCRLMRSQEKVIRYQIHALRRMKRRGINSDQVERAVRKGRKGPAKRPNSDKFELKMSKRKTMVVIAEEDDRSIWVVTAWAK